MAYIIKKWSQNNTYYLWFSSSAASCFFNICRRSFIILCILTCRSSYLKLVILWLTFSSSYFLNLSPTHCTHSIFSWNSIHTWQVLGKVFEQLFNIYSSLCTCLNEHDIKFFGQSLSILSTNLSFFCHINFISYQYYH